VLPPRILIVVNAEWYFWSHRLSLAQALQRRGCEVIVAAAVERGHRAAIEAQGFRFIPLRLQRRSIAPWQELASLLELFRLYRGVGPNLVHHVTIKPVLYGSLAAKAAGVPAVINTIPGLGYVFLQSDWRRWLLRQSVSLVYRLALTGRQVRVILQNPDDLSIFVSHKLVSAERVVIIRGSGVDVSRFLPAPEPPGPPIILLASRLLWDKGVGELVEAARCLKQAGWSCRVVLVGIPDDENPNSIPNETLQHWQAEGVIEWWGLRDDMPEVLKAVSIVALPSYYREGVPMILLEAAASGRPIITTDMPGCREVVRPGENGLLVPPRDAKALYTALCALLQDPALRTRMGARSREIAVAEFSEEHVLKQTLAVYQELLGEQWPR
jgi:glycosyltransferase involved in cell wall biosynthesis